jgi:hypothetical protein
MTGGDPLGGGTENGVVCSMTLAPHFRQTASYDVFRCHKISDRLLEVRNRSGVCSSKRALDKRTLRSSFDVNINLPGTCRLVSCTRALDT